MAVLATETWTGTTGAAWPAQWTTNNNTGVATIQANAGQQVAQSTHTVESYLASMATTTRWDATCTVSANNALGWAGLSVGGWLGDFFMISGYTLALDFTGSSSNISVLTTDAPGTATQRATASLALSPSTTYNVRFQRVGGVVRGKVWTGAEPATWTVSWADTINQPAGQFQLSGYGASGITTLTWDNLTVTDLSSGPNLVTTYGPGALANTGTRTASVTTAVGDLLVLVAMTENGTRVPSTPTGGTGLTWTLRQDPNSGANGNFGEVKVWTATATTAETFTCSVGVSGANNWTWELWRFADHGGYGGAAGTTNGGSAPSLSYTTTRDDSALIVVVDDWNAVDGTTRTWRTGAGALTENLYSRVLGAATVYAGYHADAGAAGAMTVGLSAPTGQLPAMVAIEVLPVAGSSFSGTGSMSGTGSLAITPQMTARGTVSLSGAGALGVGGAATPSLRAAVKINDGQSATSSSTAVTIPATAHAGDVAFIDVVIGNQTDTITTPSGWTLISGPDLISTTSASMLYSKTLVSGDLGATVTLARSAAGRLAGNLTIVADTVPSAVTLAKNTDSANTTTVTVPSLSAVPHGSMILVAMPRRVGGVTPADVATPTGYTDDVDHVGTAFAAGANLSSETCYKITPTTGSYGGETAAVSSSAGSTYALVLPPSSTDAVAPTAPTTVTATVVSANSVTIAWSGATDNVGVASYRVRRDGVDLAGATAVTGSSFSDTTTLASTTYSYTVSAADAAGNRSAESSAASATTPSSAAPTRVGATGGFGGSGSVAASTPTGTAVGDLLVTAVHNDNTGNAIATPTGWVRVLGPIADAQAGDGWHYVFRRFADGTSADTPTWTSAGSTDTLAYLVVAARGVDARTPVHLANSTAGTGTPTAAVSMTTTITSLVLNFVGDRKGSADTAPRFSPVDTTHWTNGLDLGVSAGSPSLSLHSTYLTQAAPGAVPGQTYTQSSSTNGYVLTQVALAPTGSTPAGTQVFALTGTPDGSSVPVRIKTSAAGSVRLKVATDAGLSVGTSFTAAQAPDGFGYTAHSITGLSAGTTYYYAAEVDGVLATDVGSFTTDTPATARNFRVAFGSCLDSGSSNGTAFTNIATNAPEAFIHLGDWHYDNSTATDASLHQASLENQLTGNSPLRSLVRSVPLAYAWSDHDSGGNNWSGGPATWTPSYLSAYAEVIPVAAALPSGGIYRSFGRGRVKFILTDSRSFRSLDTATDDASKTMFGFDQEAWIAGELADATYPVKVLCTDVPWVATPTAGADNWGGFTAAAARLVAAIQSAGAHVFLIHGDSHMLAADNGTSVNNPGGLPMACAAPFGQTTAIKGGPYSQGTYSGGTGSFQEFHGLLDVTDTGTAITIRYSGRDSANVEQVSLTQTWLVASAALSGSGGLSAVGGFGATPALSGSGGLSATLTGQSATAPAALAGSGGLTGLGTPGALKAAALTGSGALSTSAPILGVVIAGSGSLSLTRTVQLPGGPVATAGSGSLSVLGIAGGKAAPALSGSGALLVAGIPGGLIGGTGTLAVVGRAGGRATVATSGSGTLAATTKAGGVAAPALSGSGTLAFTSGIYGFTPTPALTGSGALSTTGTPAPTRGAALGGVGALSSAALVSPRAATALTGSGALAPLGIATPGGLAALSGSGALVGNGGPQIVAIALGYAVQLTGSGRLLAAGALVGQSRTAATSALGTLSVVGVYPAGSGALGAVATVNLAGSGALSSIAAVLAHGIGTLGGAGALSAVGAPGSLGTAALSGAGALLATQRVTLRGAAAYSGSGVVTVVAAVGVAARAGVNLLTNPSAAVDLTGYSINTDTGTFTLTRVTGLVGPPASTGLDFSWAAAARSWLVFQDLIGPAGTLKAGQTYTLSYWARQVSGSSAGALLSIRDPSFANQVAQNSFTFYPAAWTRFIWTFVPGIDSLATSVLYATPSGPTAAGEIQFAAFQIEKGPVASPYTDNSYLVPSGTGTLSVNTATPAGTRTAALSGGSSLVVGAPTVTRTVTPALSGSGTTTVAVTPRPTVGLYFSLAGSGTLSSVSGIYGFTPTAALGGRGALSIAATPRLIQGATLAGLGALAVAMLVGPKIAAALGGVGTLSAANPVPNATPRPQLVGSGTVTVAPTVRFGGNVAIAGIGTLSRVTAAQLSAHANTAALGTLVAAGTTFFGTATQTGLGALAITYAKSRIVRSAYRLEVEPAPPFLLVRLAPPTTGLVAGPSHPR